MEFITELEQLINRHSKDNECNTSDYILAVYLNGCLDNFKTIVKARDAGRIEPVNYAVSDSLNTATLNLCPKCGKYPVVEGSNGLPINYCMCNGIELSAQGSNSAAPLKAFADIVETIANPKDKFCLGGKVFREGDSVYGSWVDCDGRSYFVTGTIIKNSTTGLWVQGAPGYGGITEVKRFHHMGHNINGPKSAPRTTYGR